MMPGWEDLSHIQSSGASHVGCTRSMAFASLPEVHSQDCAWLETISVGAPQADILIQQHVVTQADDTFESFPSISLLPVTELTLNDNCHLLGRQMQLSESCLGADGPGLSKVQQLTRTCCSRPGMCASPASWYILPVSLSAYWAEIGYAFASATGHVRHLMQAMKRPTLSPLFASRAAPQGLSDALL